MMRFTRPSAPRGLRAAAPRRLEAAISAFDAFGIGSAEHGAGLVGYGSKKTKERLFDAQGKKCAWCDRRRDFSSSPVEHFRPRDGAVRRGGRVDRGHYWWLTWTWENLLFACARCNDQGHKGNHFPATRVVQSPPRPFPATKAARSRLFDMRRERPLLLDPAADDPLVHIAWRPCDPTMARDLWIWEPRGLSARGWTTIRILKLAELADEVGDPADRGRRGSSGRQQAGGRSARLGPTLARRPQAH